MSWVTSVSYSGEDVFDEDADDISLQNKEWKHNMEKRVKVTLMLAIVSKQRNIAKVSKIIILINEIYFCSIAKWL